MKKILILLYVIGGSLLFGCGGDDHHSRNTSPSLPSAPAPAPPAKNIDGILDQYLRDHLHTQSAGMAIIVRYDGEVVYHASKGMADSIIGTSITAQTGMRLASVSKPFTAIAVMQLVEQQQIAVDDSILTYLPELPESWRAITIAHLLKHRSGIYDLLNDLWSHSLLNEMTLEDVIPYFQLHPQLEFSPNTRMEYSNTGYMMLAIIVSRVSGMPFADYMRNHIFEPANMVDTYIYSDTQPIKAGDALNFAVRDTYFGISLYLYGSMAQVSSTTDLGAFFVAIENNELIEAETLNQMLNAQGNNSGGTFGFGWFLGQSGQFSHDGSWDGFRTTMTFDPSRNLQFAILVNGGHQDKLNAVRNLIISHYTP